MTKLAVTSVHKTLSELNSRLGRCEGRGIGDEGCSVRAHRFELFNSRFCSRFQVHLHRTRSLSPLIVQSGKVSVLWATVE